MTNSNPIIIIGGGHNGLVCATYLARAGHTVTLLEARDQVGGAASTVEFAPGYQVSALAHTLHGLHPKVIRELGLESRLQRGPELRTISLNAGGRHLTLDANTATAEDLSDTDASAYAKFKQEFRAYAAALEPLTINKPPRLKDMDFADKVTLAKLGWKLRFGLGAETMNEFLRVGGINIYDVLNEIFDDPRVKGAIAVDAVMGHHMGPRTPTTVLTYLNHLRGENYGPRTSYAGGMGALAQLLNETAEEAGVSIRTGCKVEKIEVEGDRATAVVLESGERLPAAAVVSNADARSTFLDLVGASRLDAMFAHRVHTHRARGAVAKINLALSDVPTFNGLSQEQLGQRLLIAPDMRYVEHAFNHAKYGEYSTRPVLEIVVPSMSDPALAPEGGSVVSILATFAPYQLREGWDGAREAFADSVVELLEEYAPGISELIVARQLMTPEDIERDYGITGGHWHHGELGIDQMFMMRPLHGAAQYDTPIPGLYLCGATAHPGGDITGIPGHNAAQRILKLEASS